MSALDDSSLSPWDKEKMREFLSLMCTEVSVKFRDGMIREYVPLQVHSVNLDTCNPCCIHNPSSHPLNQSKLVWIPHLHRMDRMCDHGVTHPDPDDLSYKRKYEGWSTLDVWQEVHLYHACDGCCIYAGHRCIVCEGEDIIMDRKEE